MRSFKPLFPNQVALEKIINITLKACYSLLQATWDRCICRAPAYLYIHKGQLITFSSFSWGCGGFVSLEAKIFDLQTTAMEKDMRGGLVALSLLFVFFFYSFPYEKNTKGNREKHVCCNVQLLRFWSVIFTYL